MVGEQIERGDGDRGFLLGGGGLVARGRGRGRCGRGLGDFDRRALTIEVGMQNSGLALGLIFTQFGAQPDMALIAALWGTWHIVSGLLLVALWRRNPPHLHTEKEEQPCAS